MTQTRLDGCVVEGCHDPPSDGSLCARHLRGVNNLRQCLFKPCTTWLDGAFRCRLHPE